MAAAVHRSWSAGKGTMCWRGDGVVCVYTKDLGEVSGGGGPHTDTSQHPRSTWLDMGGDVEPGQGGMLPPIPVQPAAGETWKSDGVRTGQQPTSDHRNGQYTKIRCLVGILL
jgi:hypothetical protein